MPDTPDETDLFASLAVYDPDLVERCAAHVRSGAEPDLPETLAQLAAQALPAEAGFDLATVGELFAILMPEPRMVPSCTTTARQAVWQAMQGRGVDRWSVCPTHLKYHVLAAPTAQQVVRLARVLAALSTPDRLVDGVPVWCTALVNIRDTIAPLREDLAPRLRQQWDCDWLSTVLAASGTPHDQIPAQVLLVTFQTPEYFQPGSVPVDLPGLDEYLVGHAAQIPPGTTAALDPRARVILVSRTSLADGLPAVVGELTCDPAKTVRVAAVTALQRLPAAIQAEVLRAPLAQVPAAQAMQVVDYLVVADHGPAVLDQAVSVNPLLDPAVAQARQRRAVLGADVPVALPPYEPVPDEPLTVAEVERMLARSHAQYGSLPPVPWTWTPCTSVQADDITGDDIAQFVAMANGTASPGASPVMALLEHMGIHQAVRLLPGLGLHHRLRLAGCAGTRWGEDVYIYAIHPGTDLRAVHDALVTHNYPPEVATTIVADRVGWSDPKASWPWLAQHPEQARPWLDGQGQTMALRVFASARYVPPALAPKVASIALGNAKAPRRLAQQALVNHPGARLLAEPGLAASKPETRAAAARWLAVLGDAAAVGPLRAALATEMSQMVRAAMLDALEALGADLDAELSPAALTAEAATGTKRPPPAAMAWFPFDALPALRWPDGSPVAPHVARWWVVLAIKTKNPDGSGVLDRYLSRLDPQSADELGRMVLDAWVTHTTAHPDPAASQAHARMVATRVHAHACPPGVWDEFMANDYAVHQRTVIGTGANDKGVLALTTRMSGRVLASVASEYVRTFEYHSQPLLTAVCANGDRACAQLLVSLAQRPARTSTQATAAKLVEHLAEVRGWTTDEVADRAIPTAGFEPSFPSPGPLDWSFTLDLGARQALARISPDGSVVASVDGRVVKTLPAARTDDDPALFTAAKKHLTAVRIEVKTITATQTRRLHEAMCTRRSWSVDDWLAFVDHPLMGPVATRVIWTQDPGTSFRLTDDATCINLDDETITLDPAAPITVAHTTTLGPQATTRWREHFADYEVVPALFQLDATIPPLPPTTTTIDDHEGHATDCGTAHTLATARWYTRDDSAVDGWTLRYTRVFAALDVTATIELTRDLTGLGHAIPLDTPAFTRTLTFRRARTLLPLADLPPALVAECYDDYTTLASGPHDPCWRAKTHS